MDFPDGDLQIVIPSRGNAERRLEVNEANLSNHEVMEGSSLPERSPGRRGNQTIARSSTDLWCVPIRCIGRTHLDTPFNSR